METRKCGVGCIEKNKGHRENRDYLNTQVAPKGCLPKLLHSSVMQLAVKFTGKVSLSSHTQCPIQAGLIMGVILHHLK